MASRRRSGTQLTVINNTATPAASNPISGTFSNAPQGGTITLTYLGTPYSFQANYQGGDGNDLVLTETAGPASQLIVTSQPPPTVTAGGGFGFTVTAEDAQGHVAASFNGNTVVALASDPGSTTLGGTLIEKRRKRRGCLLGPDFEQGRGRLHAGRHR